MKSRRLFLAIPVSEELIQLANSQKEKLDLPVKWIPDSNLHITVHFFGNVEESSLQNLNNTLQKCVRPFPPFILEANSILKKSGKGNVMIWIGFKESSSFENLALAIAERVGVPVARKPLPHVNLARHKERITSEQLPLSFPSPLTLEVTHLELWESKLSPKGSTYLPLKSFTLKGSKTYEKER